MRTTLEIDDDVFHAAKEIAANRRTTMGKVLSELARRGLTRPKGGRARNGVPLIAQQRLRSTMADVNLVRDET